MKALGLLIRLLCRPDGFQTNSETLALEFECGRDAIRGALRELSDAGYIRLHKSQDKGGLWRSAWHVFDCDAPPPSAAHPSGEPKTGFPASVYPVPVNPSSVASPKIVEKSTLEGVASQPDVGYTRARPSSINTNTNTNTNTHRTNTSSEINNPGGKGSCQRGDEGSAVTTSPAADAPSKPKACNRQRLVSLAEWRETIKAKGERSIPEGDPIFAYADKAKLTEEMLHVQWHHFVATYTEDRTAKRYTDWRAAFRNSVRQNWFRLWVIEPVGGAKWSSLGLQAQAVFQASQGQTQPEGGADA